MTAGADRWIRWTTTGCVALLALIAGTVSYLHMHALVELHGQPGWVAALTPLSVDGMIVAASTTLLADSRAGECGGKLPWALLVVGSAAGLAANVAVAQPTAAGRVIAAWPSFALISAYELLMRQVRHGAEGGGQSRRERRPRQLSTRETSGRGGPPPGAPRPGRAAEGPGPGAAPARGCGGRRGRGRRPTEPVTACCPAGGRSPASTVGRSAGAAWSNGPARQANSMSAVNLANQACIWSGHNSPSATGPNKPAPTQSDHSVGAGIGAHGA